ncbi:MAG: hypothetical protein LCH96_05190 [Actinobacteria bacterium]|nr:hypothetical protein [Actinomycetota bacterium]
MYGSRFADDPSDAVGTDYVPRLLRAMEIIQESSASQGPIEPPPSVTSVATLEPIASLEPVAVLEPVGSLEPVALPLVTVPTGRAGAFPGPDAYLARHAAPEWGAPAPTTRGLFRRRVDPARLIV